METPRSPQWLYGQPHLLPLGIDGRPINDIEAAYAYCGCSGVTVWDGTNWFYPVPKHDRFDTWMKTGVVDGTQENLANAKIGGEIWMRC
jgi:hypothetical protein